MPHDHPVARQPHTVHNATDVDKSPDGDQFSWATIPSGNSPDPQAQYAEQSNICARATAEADRICKQPLRATTDDMMLYGPGTRVGARGNGPAELILENWPVLEIVSVRIARNCLPYTWTPVPAELCWIKKPVSGMYGSTAPMAAPGGGQSILVSSQCVNLKYGPDGLAIHAQYVNGWPHGGISVLAEQGASEIQVDDCTGWGVTNPLTGATGATGTLYDSGCQEVVRVTAASAAAGPGTLTLASPLLSEHQPGVIASTLPQNVEWAVIMLAVSQALTRGATSTTIHQIPGGPGGKSPGPADWVKCAAAILHDYTRII